MKGVSRVIVLCLVAIIFCTCKNLDDNQKSLIPETLFTRLNSSDAGLSFVNKCNETIERNIGSYDYFYNGGGVAIADFNNDKLPDLFFTGNDVPNKIFQNLGDLNFKDRTGGSSIQGNSWCTGVTVVDINNDGLQDIYISVSGPDYQNKDTRNLLYVNQGEFKFKEQASNYGIDDNGLTTQSIFLIVIKTVISTYGS